MKRSYVFKWYPTREVKYSKEPYIRTCTLELAKPTGITSFDAKKALEVFQMNHGNLKKNTIVKIQEFGEDGQIGEDIVPAADDNVIVPIKG